MGILDLAVVVVTVILNTAIATVVYAKNRKNATNILLAVIAIIISLWSVANYFSLNSSTEAATLFWIRMVMFVTTPLTPVIYLFTAAYPNHGLNISKKEIIAISASTVIVGILVWTPYVFSSVSLSDGINPRPGAGILSYGALMLVFLSGGFVKILQKYKNSHGIEKLQLRYLVLGVVLTFTLQIISNFVLVIFLDLSNLVVLGPTFSLILIAFISYAIVKHKLLNIKILATQIFVFLLWIIILAQVFLSIPTGEWPINLLVFVLVLLFGLLLERSVRREVEQKDQLTRLTKKLKELDSKKDEFLNVAAHELRAPMTAVKGYLSMARDGDGGKIPAVASEYLNEAADETDRLVRLVNNMLNISRIEENRLVFNMGEVNLKEVVTRVFNEQKYGADDKKLKYDLHVQDNIVDKVEVDVDRIYEVVLNLISNAVKYTDQGFVVVSLANKGEARVRFEVADSGPGLSVSEQKSLFQKFYRAESSIGKKIGTGLGLYVSKLLIEKFHGDIGFKSEKNKGSVFWFELPIKK